MKTNNEDVHNPRIVVVQYMDENHEPIMTFYTILKSEKGLRRAHRKGKCDMWCPFCEQEAIEFLKDELKVLEGQPNTPEIREATKRIFETLMQMSPEEFHKMLDGATPGPFTHLYDEFGIVPVARGK